MKFLWWYTIILYYIGLACNAYLALFENDATAFWAFAFQLPCLVLVHKIKKYVDNPYES